MQKGEEFGPTPKMKVRKGLCFVNGVSLEKFMKLN